METVFDPAVYQRLLGRVDSLTPQSSRLWGKMSVSQMLEHVARALEMAAGRRARKQAALGKLIGWAFRKDFVGPKPFGRDSPTGPDFVVQGEPDFASTAARVKALLAELHSQGEAGAEGRIHGFFGRLSGREWGITQFKHLDHHLRQFGA
jgi:hypothetical protein